MFDFVLIWVDARDGSSVCLSIIVAYWNLRVIFVRKRREPWGTIMIVNFALELELRFGKIRGML